MGKRYQVHYRIPFYETDDQGQVKLPHLLSYCLSMAGLQSESLGISDQSLLEKYGYVWIVTDYTITIKRLPHYDETIQVITEATAYNKFFCYRHFYINDAEGNELMVIKTIFVLMDFQTRKVQRVPETLVAPYGASYTKEMHRGAKYMLIKEGHKRLYHVRYFDLDLNGHVNNSKYLEWMYDVFEADFLRHHVPQQLTLKYVKEVQEGSDIVSRWQLENHVSHHEIISQGHISAQAKIEWRKNDI